MLDEPTEGIQPSIIKDIGRAIVYLRSLKQMAIILVEQYLDFARELGDRFVVMDRGNIVYSAWRDSVDEDALKEVMALEGDPVLGDLRGSVFAANRSGRPYCALGGGGGGITRRRESTKTRPLRPLVLRAARSHDR